MLHGAAAPVFAQLCRPGRLGRTPGGPTNPVRLHSTRKPITYLSGLQGECGVSSCPVVHYYLLGSLPTHPRCCNKSAACKLLCRPVPAPRRCRQSDCQECMLHVSAQNVPCIDNVRPRIVSLLRLSGPILALFTFSPSFSPRFHTSSAERDVTTQPRRPVRSDWAERPECYLGSRRRSPLGQWQRQRQQTAWSPSKLMRVRQADGMSASDRATTRLPSLVKGGLDAR